MRDAPIRLLIVDDSALYRQMISNVLRDARDVKVVGLAKDGLDAIDKIKALDPDLLTLDVQMPDMDGIGVLREINRCRLRPKAIMVSSLTTEGAQVTTDALLEGAFDFILKPTGSDSEANRNQLRGELDEKIAAYRQTTARLRRGHQHLPAEDDLANESPTLTPTAACRAVVIGTSTGGPAALKLVVPMLPATLPVPVLVVQHMPPEYTASLARRLNDLCELEVVEASNGQPVQAGTIYIAPGGRQMKLSSRLGQFQIRTTQDPHENGCRPAVDCLLRSVANVYSGQALAVIMTGMGRDGLEGCGLLKESGGVIFAQHEHGCLVYGMPKAVIEENLADRVLPLGRIGPGIIRYVEQSLSDVKATQTRRTPR